MKTAVMTDTNSGITLEEGKNNGIFVLPMPVIIDGKDYLEEVNLSHEMLYQALNENREISSSQPSPDMLLKMWDDILADGYDEIVYIPMTSGLSGACATAKGLALEYDGKIHVVDNHRISLTLLDSVYDAKYLAEKGLTAEQIKENLENNAYMNDIYITLHSLQRIVKTGRITSAGAAIATVLGIKPVLKIQGGKLDAFAKARGMKKCESIMIEAVRNDLVGKYASVPPEHLTINTAGTFEKKQDAEEWVGTVQEAFPDYIVQYRPLSCSIACHIGTNTKGIAVDRVERNTSVSK
ncbi:MAG: DegV family protein [Oscillospiraceae bacterium]|nr:DegV family protein [Oscillospiraceae bacterium]